MRAGMRFRDNSKWRTFAWCSACFSSSWLRLQNNRRRSFFFRFQEAERPTGGTPKIALDPLCFKEATLCLFSHINLVLSGFAHHKGDLGLSTFGCVHWSVVGEVAPPAPLGPGWKLKIQRLILGGTAWTDVHTKFGGLIRWGRTLEIFLKVGRFFAMFSPTVGSTRGGRS